ncbi:MAG: hypothetical protein IJ402_04450 [Bacteroidales bacterium]|nr:hypothetical protein [Bacteroidales bacterium]
MGVELVGTLVPLGICVVLPVLIVWLVTRTRQNETNKKTEIMLKAIESGATIDANFFKDAHKKQKSTKERLLNRLIWGCATSILGVGLAILGIVQWVNWNGTTSNDSFVVPLIFAGILLAIGIALFIGFFVGRKMLAREMEAEEKSLEQK